MAQPRPPTKRSLVAAWNLEQARKARDLGEVAAASTAASRSMGIDGQQALAFARAGDDTALMPYSPTPSINPPRPRTRAAGYDRDSGTMYVRFREGPVYAYYDVSPSEYNNFLRVKSPGRAINRTFNAKPYQRMYELE